MTRIEDVVRRYDAYVSISRQPIEIFAIGDPAGGLFDAAVRRALYEVGDDGLDAWSNLLRVASAARWRRLVQPQPLTKNPSLTTAVAEIENQVQQLRGFVSNEPLLDELSIAASALGETDSPVGIELLRCIEEVGPQRCVVVANNASARAGLGSWLEDFGVPVMLPGELNNLPIHVEQLYAIGPPTFYSPSLVSAPSADAVTFLMSAWFTNRSLPSSVFTEYAENPIQLRSRVYELGDLDGISTTTSIESVDDHYFPRQIWGTPPSREAPPTRDETEGRKVLLRGGVAIWLDDGERIRSLNPSHPEGERVGYESVDKVRPGTYLMLREGETERRAMYRSALQLLAEGAETVEKSQTHWKALLVDRLEANGTPNVVKDLRNLGVKSSSRVVAWTEPSLVMPKREADFKLLLDWLGIPQYPTLDNAHRLRKALYKASSDLRMKLESLTDNSSLVDLEREGFIRLEAEEKGFRGMLVTRVLALAPFTQVVPRTHLRVPFEDGSATWLE